MATSDNLVKVSQLQTVLTRVKSELDNLDGKTFSSVNVSGGKINFYASNDASGSPLASIDLPEEIFLDQTQTVFVQNFAWSSATYPGSTDPNLEGKPVLVLCVKGDKATNPTQSFSFINLESLITTYTPADDAINIAGSSIGLNLSATAGNILSIVNDGLLGEMKVAGASQGNFATFGVNGSIVDSGFSVASDADINSILVNVFGASSGS